MAGLTQRNKSTWHMRMRVPRRYRDVESRTEITRSLRTTSHKEALVRLPVVEAMIIAEFDARLTMNSNSGDRDTFAAGVALAASRGMSYRPVDELAEGPIEEILERLEALKVNDGSQVAQALLGGLKPPSLKLSGLVEEVERISQHDNRFKNENQLRLWRNPFKRAISNLIAAIGEDCEVMELDAVKARRHKSWWQARLAREGLMAETANKDFSNLSTMLARYYDDLEVPEPPRPYSRITIVDRHETPNRKLEVPIDLIIDRWFADGALNCLNVEARDILLISIETGCRQSEIHDLPSDALILDDEIPHIRVQNEDGEERREIKNAPSFRRIPLAGVALSAALRHPNGFPRYRGKSGYSNAVNKTLRANDLLPSEGITVGGTRHTWEARLLAHKFQNDERAAMMGHSISGSRKRQHYGDDMSLERKQEILKQVLLEEPEYLKFH